MYLKRLQLQGFKSFAARIALDVGPGTTAIVGPNGSGKSNLAEALRWVLGEQGSRVLRTRRVEDTVFAGTRQRPPVGLAEVSITFDNEQRWLPVEYSEVVITRRVHRSGEGEYLLNRTAVRLRDIHEMLRSAAGINSYAIIGQGMVETLLNLRPEERRLLIEEAADIQRQRYRLQGAEVRLADTLANLEKLAPLLQEMERRLTQLARQAQRAANYQRYCQSLNLALERWYGRQWMQLQQELVIATSSLSEHKQAHESALAEQGRLAAELQVAEASVASHRAAWEQAEARLGQLRAEYHHLERQIGLDHQRLAMLADQQKGLDADLARLAQDQEQLAKDEKAAQQRVQQLQNDLASLRQRLETEQRQLTVEETAIAGFRARAKAGAAATRDVTAHLEASERRHREVEQTAARCRSEATEHEAECARQKAALVELAIRLRALKADQSAAFAQAEETRGRRRTLESLVAKKRLAVAELNSRRKLLIDEVKHLSNRLASLQHPGADGRLTPAAQHLLAAMPANGRTPAEDVIGVLEHLLEVPASLEVAIAAALADSRQALVMRCQQNVLMALQKLERQQMGPLSILPMDSVRDSTHLNGAVKGPGIIGVAASLVGCPPQVRPAVNALLGRTIIVEDLAVARQVFSQGYEVDIVTRDGIILRSWGAIGYGGHSGDDGWPARQREIAETEARLQQVRTELAMVERELAGQQQGLKETERDLADLQELTASAEKALRRGDEDLLRMRTRLADTKGRLRWAVLAGKRVSSNLETAVAKLPALEQEKQRLQEASEQARRKAAEAARDLAGAEEWLRPLHEALEKARRGVAALEGELRAASRELESQRGLLTRRQQETAAKREQLLQAVKGREDGSERLAVAEAALAEQRERLAAATAAREESRQMLATAEKSVARLRREYDAAQGLSLASQAQMLQARAAVDRNRDALAALRRAMIADDVAVPDENGQPLLSDVDPEDITRLEREIERLRARLRGLGAVDPQAPADYQELKERYDFLAAQVADLREAEAHLREGIERLRQAAEDRFGKTLEQVSCQFQHYFQVFFGGGQASLSLVTGSRGIESGVELSVQLPGKRIQGLSLLSAGEKSLTALALLFALLYVQPSPYCVLDEVDSALDEANAARFAQGLRSLASTTQFIVITHNRRTMEAADTIYGVSMGEDGTSRVLSLRLSDLPLV